jgi:hypothetical protein
MYFHEIELFQYFFEYMLRQFNLYWQPTRITSALRADPCTFMVISRSVLRRIRNILDKFVEKIKEHILCSAVFFQKSSRLWKNVENHGRAKRATDDRMLRRKTRPILVAVWSKVIGPWPLDCWDAWFEYRQGHGCPSVVNICVVR